MKYNKTQCPQTQTSSKKNCWGGKKQENITLNYIFTAVSQTTPQKLRASNHDHLSFLSYHFTEPGISDRGHRECLFLLHSVWGLNCKIWNLGLEFLKSHIQLHICKVMVLATFAKGRVNRAGLVVYSLHISKRTWVMNDPWATTGNMSLGCQEIVDLVMYPESNELCHISCQVALRRYQDERGAPGFIAGVPGFSCHGWLHSKIRFMGSTEKPWSLGLQQDSLGSDISQCSYSSLLERKSTFYASLKEGLWSLYWASQDSTQWKYLFCCFFILGLPRWLFQW